MTGDDVTPPNFNLRHPGDFESTTYRRGALYWYIIIVSVKPTRIVAFNRYV